MKKTFFPSFLAVGLIILLNTVSGFLRHGYSDTKATSKPHYPTEAIISSEVCFCVHVSAGRVLL